MAAGRVGGRPAPVLRFLPCLVVLAGLSMGWYVLLYPRFAALPLWARVLVVAAAGAGIVAGLVASDARRRPAPLLFVGFWVLWAATLPATTAWAPQSVPVRREVTAMASIAVPALLALAASRGRRRGLEAFRLTWIVVGVTTLPVALVEIGTGRHLPVRGDGWPFPPRLAAATFLNPNNYACVLLIALGVTAVVVASAAGRAIRLVAAFAGLVFLALIVTSGSRAALLVALGQLAVVAAVALVRHRSAAGAPLSWRRVSPAALVGAVVVVVVVGAALLLSPRNPLARLLHPQASGSAASDDLRLRLTQAGLRHFVDAPWLGTGAGSFEPLLAREGGLAAQTNMHDAFVELLSQYGLFVTLPFAALLVVLVAQTFGAGVPAGRGPERLELGLLLMGIVVMGLTVSSALTFPMWWFALAHATAAGWFLARPAGALDASRPVTAHMHT